MTYDEIDQGRCRGRRHWHHHHHRHGHDGPCRAFRRMRESARRRGRFVRDADNGMIAGVCAGIARHLGVRPKLVRIVTILSLVIFTVPTVVAYGLMAWLAPSDADSDRVGEASGARDGEPAPDGYRGEGGAAEGLARLKTRFRRLEEKFADVEAQMLNEATD